MNTNIRAYYDHAILAHIMDTKISRIYDHIILAHIINLMKVFIVYYKCLATHTFFYINIHDDYIWIGDIMYLVDCILLS